MHIGKLSVAVYRDLIISYVLLDTVLTFLPKLDMSYDDLSYERWFDSTVSLSSVWQCHYIKTILMNFETSVQHQYIIFYASLQPYITALSNTMTNT